LSKGPPGTRGGSRAGIYSNPPNRRHGACYKKKGGPLTKQLLAKREGGKKKFVERKGSSALGRFDYVAKGNYTNLRERKEKKGNRKGQRVWKKHLFSQNQKLQKRGFVTREGGKRKFRFPKG